MFFFVSSCFSRCRPLTLCPTVAVFRVWCLKHAVSGVLGCQRMVLRSILFAVLFGKSCFWLQHAIFTHSPYYLRSVLKTRLKQQKWNNPVQSSQPCFKFLFRNAYEWSTLKLMLHIVNFQMERMMTMMYWMLNNRNKGHDMMKRTCSMKIKG